MKIDLDLESGKMYRLCSNNKSGYVRLFNLPGFESDDAIPLNAFGPLIRDTNIVMYLELATGGMGAYYVKILWDSKVYIAAYENIGNKVENI